MNKLITNIMLCLSFITLVGCSQNSTNISRDNNIDKVSPKHTTKEAGYMQNMMDSFLEDDWMPTISKDENIQKKYMKKNSEVESSENDYIEDKDRAFTLQEYLDKAKAYSDAKPTDYNSSNSKKLDEMPIIGK